MFQRLPVRSVDLFAGVYNMDYNVKFVRPDETTTVGRRVSYSTSSTSHTTLWALQSSIHSFS